MSKTIIKYVVVFTKLPYVFHPSQMMFNNKIRAECKICLTREKAAMIQDQYGMEYGNEMSKIYELKIYYSESGCFTAYYRDYEICGYDILKSVQIYRNSEFCRSDCNIYGAIEVINHMYADETEMCILPRHSVSDAPSYIYGMYNITELHHKYDEANEIYTKMIYDIFGIKVIGILNNEMLAVKLPEGWTINSSIDDGNSALIDNKGRLRASIKTESFERCVIIDFKCRYNYLLETSFDDNGILTGGSIKLTDAGSVIDDIGTWKCNKDDNFDIGHFIAQYYLEKMYPRYNDYMAYWDDIDPAAVQRIRLGY